MTRRPNNRSRPSATLFNFVFMLHPCSPWLLAVNCTAFLHHLTNSIASSRVHHRHFDSKYQPSISSQPIVTGMWRFICTPPSTSLLNYHNKPINARQWRFSTIVWHVPMPIDRWLNTISNKMNTPIGHASILLACRSNGFPNEVRSSTCSTTRKINSSSLIPRIWALSSVERRCQEPMQKSSIIPVLTIHRYMFVSNSSISYMSHFSHRINCSLWNWRHRSLNSVYHRHWSASVLVLSREHFMCCRCCSRLCSAFLLSVSASVLRF